MIRPDILHFQNALQRAAYKIQVERMRRASEHEGPDGETRERFARRVGTSVRSVDRWIENGMPVYQPTGGPKGSVIILIEDALAWIREHRKKITDSGGTKVGAKRGRKRNQY